MSPGSRRTDGPGPEDDGVPPRRRSRPRAQGPDLDDMVVFETVDGQPRLAQRPDGGHLYAFERPDSLSPYPAQGQDAALPVLHQASRLAAAREGRHRVRVLPVEMVPTARVTPDLPVAAPADRWLAERVALLADLDVVVTLADDQPSTSEVRLVRRLQLAAASVGVERVAGGRGRRLRFEALGFDQLQEAHDTAVAAALLGTKREKLPARRPRNPDLVEGFIQSGLVLVVGPAWSGKSTIIAGLCDAVAKGRDWLGRPTQAGAVLVACGEAAEAMRNRCQAVAAAHPERGIGPAVVEVLWRLHDENSDYVLRRLEDTLRLVPDARLLVIDTLASVTRGMPESDSSAMGVVLGRLKKFMRAHPQMTVIVIHHPLKSGEGVRGHGSLEAQADAKLDVQEVGGQVELSLKHSRDLPAGASHRFVLEDRDGVAFARPVEGGASSAAPGAQKAGRQRQGQRHALVKAAREAGGPVHRDDLMTTTGFGKTLFHNLVKDVPELRPVAGRKGFYEYVPPAAAPAPQDQAGAP